MLSNQSFYIWTFFGIFAFAYILRLFLFHNEKYKNENKLFILDVFYNTDLYFFISAFVYTSALITGLCIMHEAYLPEHNGYRIFWGICLFWQLTKVIIIFISMHKCRLSYEKKTKYIMKYDIDKVKVVEIKDSYSSEEKTFHAYTLSKHKEYNGEKWDEIKYKILFSHEEILKELIQYKNLDIANSACTEILDETHYKLILDYLNIKLNEDSDIVFDKLYYTKCKINDTYNIDIIVGYNKNLNTEYKQFLCFAYYYWYCKERKVVADYSIDKLLSKVKSIIGNFEKLED